MSVHMQGLGLGPGWLLGATYPNAPQHSYCHTPYTTTPSIMHHHTASIRIIVCTSYSLHRIHSILSYTIHLISYTVYLIQPYSLRINVRVGGGVIFDA